MGEMTEIQALEYALDSFAWGTHLADLEPMGVIIAMIKERRRRKETMIKLVARELWRTNLLRDATKPDGIQNLAWEDLLKAARSDVMAKVLFDRVRMQARAVLTAMREPTDAMIRAAGSGPADLSCWQRIIDAALEEG